MGTYTILTNNIMIANMFYEHKDIYKHTRKAKGHNERSIIDYFIVKKDKRYLFKDVKINRSGEIASDHYLVVDKLQCPDSELACLYINIK